MVISATTAGFKWARDDAPMADADIIRMMAKGGFQYVDLNLDVEAAPGMRLSGDRWEEYVDEIGNVLAETGVEIVQAHAYFISGGKIWTPEQYDYLYRANNRLIEVCGRLNIPVIVGHPINGVNSDNLSFDQVVEQSVTYFRHYQDSLAKYGVRMAIENLIAHYTNDAETIAAVADRLPREQFGNCWDAGHAWIRGLNQRESIAYLGDRLIATHLHDNWGTEGKDWHMVPFSGTDDWENIVHTLRDIGYKGALDMELNMTRHSRSMMLDNIVYCRKIADKLLAL